MKIDELFNKLSVKKPEIEVRHKNSRFGKTMDLADYCMQFYPEYYNKIIIVIDKLGSLTEVNGHNNRLTTYKNRFFGLINL